MDITLVSLSTHLNVNEKANSCLPQDVKTLPLRFASVSGAGCGSHAGQNWVLVGKMIYSE